MPTSAIVAQPMPHLHRRRLRVKSNIFAQTSGLSKHSPPLIAFSSCITRAHNIKLAPIADDDRIPGQEHDPAMLLTGTLCIPHPSAAVYHGWMETRISQDYTYKVGKELDSKVPGNGEHRYCVDGE